MLMIRRLGCGPFHRVQDKADRIKICVENLIDKTIRRRLWSEGPGGAHLTKTAAPKERSRMMLTKALVVKNAAFMRLRSSARTSVC